MSQFQRQSLAVLSCNADRLTELIRKVEKENPIVEVRWNHTRGGGMDHPSYIESLPGREPTVLDDIRLQFHIAAPVSLYPAGEYLIGSLDDRGYLPVDVEEMEDPADVSAEQVRQALRILRSLDPPGIGARDLKESLLLQLERSAVRDRYAAAIVEDCLEMLADKKYEEIAEKLGTDSKTVLRSAAVIRSLNPYPFYGMISRQGPEQYVMPDLLFTAAADHVEVSLTDTIPEIRIEAIDLRRDVEAAEWASGYVREIRYLTSAIARRNATLLRIGQVLADRQRDYFLYGAPLKPFTQRDAAALLDHDPSTISRAIEGKYLQFETRCMRLKDLFEPKLSSGSSRDEIKAIIKHIIDNENADSPVSDGQIHRYLVSLGISISKRTITKYRQQLRIPAADRRQRIHQASSM